MKDNGHIPDGEPLVHSNGRKSLLTKDALRMAIEAAEVGANMADIAGVAGCAHGTLNHWMQRGAADEAAGRESAYRVLRHGILRARHKGRVANLRAIQKHREEDWRAPAWMLERNGYPRPTDVRISGQVEHEHRHLIEMSTISAAVSRVVDADVAPAGLLGGGDDPLEGDAQPENGQEPSAF